MFLYKVSFIVFALCFYSANCKFDEDSPEDSEYEHDNSKESDGNKIINKNDDSESFDTESDQEKEKLKSTIETSVCNHQDSRKSETDVYMNTLIAYPYAASIQRKGSHYASGALVDERWVLSVASEFYNVRESIKLFRVRLGSVDCKRGGSVFPIKAISIHPLFVKGKPSFDLALLRLPSPVEPTFARSPVALSDEAEIVVRAKFLTTYWPRLVVNDNVLPATAQERVKFTNMRVSTQSLIPTSQCMDMVQGLDSSNMCLKPVVTHHSVCMPDAGAPVVAKDGLWGITSGWISPNCLSERSPTLFTRVSEPSVKSWIDSMLLP